MDCHRKGRATQPGVPSATRTRANVKAAIERLNKLATHFPENRQQLTESAARIEPECDGIMKSLLAEAFARMETKLGGSGGGAPRGADRTRTPFPSPQLV